MRITFDRTQLMELATVDGVRERDPLTTKFREFKPQRRLARHTVIEDETERPDIASFRVYGTVKLWWFLLKYNDQVDPYETPAHEMLSVPNVLDFYEFMRTQKVSN